MTSCKTTTTMVLIFAVLFALFCLTATHAAMQHAFQSKIEDNHYHVWGHMAAAEDVRDDEIKLTSVQFDLSDPNVYVVDVRFDLQCASACRYSNYELLDNVTISATHSDDHTSQAIAILPRPVYLRGAIFRYNFAIQLARRDVAIPFPTPLHASFRFVRSNDEFAEIPAETTPQYALQDEANNDDSAYIGKNQRGLVAIVEVAPEDGSYLQRFTHYLQIPTVYNPLHIPITKIRVMLAGAVWNYGEPKGAVCFINGVEWGEVVVEWSWLEHDHFPFVIQQRANTPPLHHNHGMPMHIDCPDVAFFRMQSGYLSRSTEIGWVAVELSGASPEQQAFETVISPKLSVNQRLSQGSQMRPTPPISSAVRLSVGARQHDETTKTTKSSLLTTLYWVSDKVNDLNDITFFAVFTNAFRPTPTRGNGSGEVNTLSVALPELSSTWGNFSDNYHPEVIPKQHADKYHNNVVYYTTDLPWLNDTTISFKAMEAFTTVFTSTQDVQELFLSLEAHVEHLTPQLGALPNAATVTWYYSAPCAVPYGTDSKGEVCTYLASTLVNDLLQPDAPTTTTPTQHVKQALTPALEHHVGLVLGGDVTKNLPTNNDTNGATIIDNMTLTINAPGSLVFTASIPSGNGSGGDGGDDANNKCSYRTTAEPVETIFGTITMRELLEPMHGGTIQPFRELIVAFDAPPPPQWQGHVHCAAVNLTKAWGVDDQVVDDMIIGGEYMLRWDVVTTTTAPNEATTTTTQIYTGVGMATPWAKPVPAPNKSSTQRLVLFFLLFALLFLVVFFVSRCIITQRRKRSATNDALAINMSSQYQTF